LRKVSQKRKGWWLTEMVRRRAARAGIVESAKVVV